MKEEFANDFRKAGTVGLKFIDIRDTSGRQSSFTVHEDTVTVLGGLPHNTEFSFNEFRKLARNIDKALDPTDERARLNGGERLE